jgi:hypothetical protein
MSGFIGAQGTSMASIGGLRASDERLNAMDFRPEAEFAEVWAIAEASYANEWWPGSTFMGDQDVDGASMLGQDQNWGEIDQAAGAASAFGFAGITRDQYGSPLPACTVKLFRTADDVLLDTQVSDANGAFVMRTSYYPDQHYIYTRKAGSPDVQGVSVNTLIGT